MVASKAKTAEAKMKRKTAAKAAKKAAAKEEASGAIALATSAAEVKRRQTDRRDAEQKRVRVVDKHFAHVSLELRTQKVDAKGKTLDQLITEKPEVKAKRARISAKEWALVAAPFLKGEHTVDSLTLQEGDSPSEELALALVPLMEEILISKSFKPLMAWCETPPKAFSPVDCIALVKTAFFHTRLWIGSASTTWFSRLGRCWPS